mgnify:CR=1 FL=1
MQSKQQQKLQALVNAGRLESIPFDAGIFTEQTNSCSLFRSDAIFLIEKDSVQGAFSVAYTYMRKSATLLLAVRQVRPTARGGHRVISDVLAFEPQLPKQLVIDYEKLREKRNKVEYPSAFVEDVDIALINRCIAIGDLLLAAAQRTVSS